MARTSPLPSTPYTVPVRDLMHRPGEQRARELTIDVPERMGEGLAFVAAGAELDIALRLESVHEGILVSGTANTIADAECGRCLTALALDVEVEFQELFAYSLQDGIDYEIQDDHVDLEPVVRDAVVLSLPFQPVCANGCASIELGSGISLVLADESPEALVDPRWSALAALASGENTDEGAPPHDSDTK